MKPDATRMHPNAIRIDNARFWSRLSVQGAVLLCLGCNPQPAVEASHASAPTERRRAPDWLAHLPTCAMSEVHRPRGTHIEYPQPGLPALVPRGGRLSTRVRVAAPLTPPPGIQQEAALAGWRAVLLGRGHVLDQAEHRYALRVADVRPDGTDSLVYRANIDVPPWVAPGTYSLELEAPGSTPAVAVASVRVHAAGAPPVLRVLPPEFAEGVQTQDELAARLDGLRDDGVEIDAYLVGPATKARLGRLLTRPTLVAGVPWLDTERRGALIRIDEDAYLRLGGCDDPFVSFESAVAVLERAGRAATEILEPVVDWSAGRWDAQTFHSGAERTVRVVIEEGVALEFLGATVEGWFPAVPPRPSAHRPSLVALVAVAPGTPLRVQRLESESAQVAIEGPSTLTSESVGRFVAAGDSGFDPTVTVWSWEEDGAAYQEGPAASFGFKWLGPAEVFVVAIDPSGRAARASRSLEVQTTRRNGCSVSGPGSARSRSPLPYAGMLFGAAVLCRIVWKR